ncbi:hypothetical protein [Vibrio harveyi]|uniref:hypothetical protein n=1 Tax=Vibrio harveyi TaxID=669 RepID=UPI00217E9670|nr:hypothetical protein [Vibrio harveyi]
MRTVADSGKYGYGISKHKYDGFCVMLPLPDGTKYQNTFSTKNKARQVQLVIARTEWGLERFALLKRGRLAILRKFGAGVSVRKTISKCGLVGGRTAEYEQFGVFWYEHDGKPKSKLFSYKRYGDNAEIEANWFAAKQRARLAYSELNLPPHWTAETFEVKA